MFAPLPGSTFGGNPLACAVAEEAMRILIDENLPENAEAMGKLLRAGLNKLRTKYPDAVRCSRVALARVVVVTLALM